ncbi:lipopolysaccharide biosynthesis protein [Aquipuribacter hungaricus]|uniref:Lipopolysaccharide biosynthesis protein n=1 Tax=Aquipuribacter hungaricus TaxID=545624 RepID=A0ABV7WBM3_9MICO
MAERLGRAGLVSLAGGATGAVAGLALSVLVGRAYGDTGAGLFFSTVAVFTIAANVLELGADTALVRQLSRAAALGEPHRARSTVLVAVVPVLVVGGLALALLWWAVPSFLDGATGEAVRRVLPLALVASLLAVVLGASRGLGRIVPFTLLWSVGLPATRLLLVAGAVALGLDVGTSLDAWAVAAVPALLVSVVVLHRALRGTVPAPGTAAPGVPQPVRRRLAGEAREFWGFAAARGVAAALEILLSWVDVVLVAVLASPAAAGVYAVVSRAVTAGLLVDTAARVAVSPRMSALLATGHRVDAGRLQALATRAMVLLAWPFYVTLGLFAPAVLGLFGPEFVVGAPAMAVLCGAMMLLVGAGMTQTLLLMGGRSRWQMTNKAVALAVLVVGDVLLVPGLGVLGAALAWAAAIAVDTVLAVVQVDRGLGVAIRPRDQLLAGALSLGVVGGVGAVVAATVGRDLTGLAMHAAVAVPAYALACVLLRRRLGLSAELLRGRPGAPAAGSAAPAPVEG